MVATCEKHSRYAPKCKACQDAKRQEEEGTIGAPINSKQEKFNSILDVRTGRQLFDGRRFERVFVPSNEYVNMDRYIEIAHGFGYKLLMITALPMRAELLVLFSHKSVE